MKMSDELRISIKRKIAAALMASMLMNLFPVTAFAAPVESEITIQPAAEEQANISYVDDDGNSQTQEATILTGNETTLTSGWYAVTEDITYDHSLILNGSGEYNLILTDGTEMEIDDSIGDFDWMTSPVSLGCLYEDARKNGIDLTVYGQQGGTGKLSIYNSSGSPDERSVVGDAINVDELTVNGGTINLEVTGSRGYGITCGNLIVNGGTVTATANGSDSNAIYSTGKITINSGQVTAHGSKAGIKSTDNYEPIYLSWENKTDYINASSFSAPEKITIEPGKPFIDNNGNYYVTANSSELSDKTNITLHPTDATLHTVIFDCKENTTNPPTQVLVDKSKAQKPASPKLGDTFNGLSFAGWYKDDDCKIKYDFDSEVTSDLNLYAKWAVRSNDLKDAAVKSIYRYTGEVIDPVVESNIGEILTKGTDYTITCKKEGSSSTSSMKEPGFYRLTITGKSPNYTGKLTDVRVCVLTFEKYDPDTEELDQHATLPANTDATVVTDSTVTMDTGWYVVTEDVNAKSRIKVNGDVNLVLCDGATLDAAGEQGSMGISVTEGNSLTIYSQAGNTGKLIAKTDNINYFAGIGGDCPGTNDVEEFPYLRDYVTGNGNAGNITIHGGEIIAKGSRYCAAIGKAGNDSTDGKGGNITIYGGMVTAGRYAGLNNSASDTGIGGPDADIHIFHCRDDDHILSEGYQGSITFESPFVIENTATIVKNENISESLGKKIIPTNSFDSYTVTFDSNDGTTVEPQIIAKGHMAVKPSTPINPGYIFEGWYENPLLYGDAYDFLTTSVMYDITLYAKWKKIDDIGFIGVNDQRITGFGSYSLMEEDYTVLPPGSYYVNKNVELPERIKVTGDVNLILGDGCTLTAKKGISVAGRDSTLNIFAQSRGNTAGALTAYGEEGNAAIGGDGSAEASLAGSAGSIDIYGGNVTANVAYEGTGIGGGRNERSGDINILGGQAYVTVSTSVSDLTSCHGIGDGYGYEGEEKSNITLGCRAGRDDYIFSPGYSGNVRIAPHQILQIYDNPAKKYSGIISNTEEIRNKKLTLSHVHQFRYTVSEGSITAACQNAGCDLPGETAVLTLSAPAQSDLIYDGTAKPAMIVDEHSISGDSVVLYKKKDGNTWKTIFSAPKDAGYYRASITLEYTGYGKATASVEYSIAKRDVTIAEAIVKDKIYDGTATVSTDGIEIKTSGVIDDDTDRVRVLADNAEFDSAEPGNNKTVTIPGFSITGEAAENYNLISGPERETAAITRRPLTIKAKDQTIRKGGTISTGLDDIEIESGSIVRDQALTSISFTSDPATYDRLTENGKITPGAAVIKSGTADVTKNYEISYTDGKLRILREQARVITAPTARKDLRYQGMPAGSAIGQGLLQRLINHGTAETSMEYALVTVSDGVGNEKTQNPEQPPNDSEFGTDASHYSAWAAGTYYVWYRAAESETLEAGVPAYVSVTIAKVPLTVKVKDVTAVYGEEIPAYDVEIKGLANDSERGLLGAPHFEYQINGEWKPAEYFHTAYPHPVPGVYPVRAIYDGDENAPDVILSYDISHVPGFLTVEPRTVSLNWGPASFVYDGPPHVPTVTITNLLENDILDESDITVTGARVNAGDYTATVVVPKWNEQGKYKLPDDNTKTFSIGKADYDRNIPNVEINVPYTASSFTASVAGKMSEDAGELTYGRIRTVSTNGFKHKDGGFEANVDQNGLVTVIINRNIQDDIVSGNTLYVCPAVDSTNYETKTITVEAHFVDKNDAGVTIDAGSSLSVDYAAKQPGEDYDSFTLNASLSNPGTGGTWTWKSSNTGVATVTGSGDKATVTVKSAGTTAITATYSSDTTTGYATLVLHVNPVCVSIPEAKKGLSYKDNIRQTGVEPDPHYTITGNEGSLPGDYIATATLKDTENHKWSDGTIDPKHIPWSIGKADGPDEPEELMGIIPTTDANIDGMITGVTTDMEYSRDAGFGKAFPCTGTRIIGLTPGTYYVRIKETATVKAGAAATVRIPAFAPPVVRAIQGLTYNGSPLALVEADAITDGEIYYAVTGTDDPEPGKDQYTAKIPAKTDAGLYIVWYEIRKTDETLSAWTYARISRKKYDAADDSGSVSVPMNVIYKAEGMIDFDQYLPEAHPGLSFSFSDVNSVLKEAPTMDEDTKRIHFFAKDAGDLPAGSDGVVEFTVFVDGMKNYQPYILNILCTFTEECPNNHKNTVSLGNEKVPNCTETGYSGDKWCQDCHAVIKGEILPIDPNNHDFDLSSGVVTKQPTVLTMGEHTYYCRRDHSHTVTKQDIPILPSDDGTDYTDLIKDVKSLSGNAALTQNETVDPETGEVTTTVTVGGEVISKIVRDPVSGREIVESKIWAGGLQSSYTYTGSAIRPSFRVYDGTRKLTEKKDYSVKYKKNKTVGTANIILKFKGNYKGTGMQTIDFSIVPAVLGRDVLAYDTGVTAQSKAQKPVPTMILAATGKAVSPKFFTATYDGADSVTGEGTYTATVSSKNKYYEGTTSANITVVKDKNLLLSNARVVFDQKSCFYTGNEILPSYKVTLGGKTLEKDVDFTETVYNGKDPGTAALMITAKPGNESGYVGSKLSSFKIRGNRKLVNAEPFSFEIQKSVPFSKSGAKASVVVKDGALTLKEGVDYTLSYRKNKAVTNGETAEAVVKGKGIYKGSVTLKYAIIRQSLSANGIYVEAADQFTALKDLASPVVTVTEGDGKKLKAETDYTVLEVDTSAPGNTEKSGEVFVTITGKGNYSEAPVKTSFRYDTASQDIGKTKLKKSISPQTYTGSYVYLGNEDLSGILYAGSKASPVYLTPGKDFTVCNYRNNRSRGKAKVTVRGIGAFAGTKVLTFKITQKKGDYKGALVGDKWQ